MNEKDDRNPSDEEEKKRETGDIKPPTRGDDDEPPATGDPKRETGDIKPPTE